MKTNLTMDEIYQEYYQKVFSYIFHHINHYQDAEDLAAEVFTKVVKKIDTFDDEKAALSTWLFNITRNTIIDYYRSKKEDYELIDNYEYIEEPQSSTDLDLDTLIQALKHLTKEERDIIILRYYQDYTLKEISEKMHLSYGITKLRHYHA